MARPQRNNVDYFPFYCEEGEKMYYIEETYGNDGFAAFVKLLRELAKVDYHYLNLSKPSSIMFLSAKCKVSKETLESIINDLVDLGKFDSELWKENKIIWCQDFVDSIQDAYFKRKNSCISRSSLLLLLEGLGIRKPSKGNSKPPKSKLKGDGNPQSIVKDNKEDNTGIPTLEEFIAHAKSRKANVNPEDVRLRYFSWVDNDWSITRNRVKEPIKNWKSTLTNTLKYLSEVYVHKQKVLTEAEEWELEQQRIAKIKSEQ